MKTSFTDRRRVTQRAEEWLEEHQLPVTPFNIVTALSALDLIPDPWHEKIAPESNIDRIAREMIAPIPGDDVKARAADLIERLYDPGPIPGPEPTDLDYEVVNLCDELRRPS